MLLNKILNGQRGMWDFFDGFRDYSNVSTCSWMNRFSLQRHNKYAFASHSVTGQLYCAQYESSVSCGWYLQGFLMASDGLFLSKKFTILSIVLFQKYSLQTGWQDQPVFSTAGGTGALQTTSVKWDHSSSLVRGSEQHQFCSGLFQSRTWCVWDHLSWKEMRGFSAF